MTGFGSPVAAQLIVNGFLIRNGVSFFGGLTIFTREQSRKNTKLLFDGFVSKIVAFSK